MGLYRKKCCLDTQIMEIEYLESKFFSIDPKGNTLLDFMTEKVSECHFFLYRPIQKKKDNFPKILYKVYNFLIDFLQISVIVTIEQMKQKACESVLCQINIVRAFYECRHSTKLRQYLMVLNSCKLYNLM